MIICIGLVRSLDMNHYYSRLRLIKPPQVWLEIVWISWVFWRISIWVLYTVDSRYNELLETYWNSPLYRYILSINSYTESPLDVSLGVEKCSLYRKVRVIERSVISRGPLYQEVRYIKRSVIPRGPLYQEVRYIKRSAISRGPLYQEVRYIKRSVISKGPLYRDREIRYIKRSVISEGPLYREVRCIERYVVAMVRYIQTALCIGWNPDSTVVVLKSGWFYQPESTVL